MLLGAAGGYVLWRRGQTTSPQPATTQPADAVKLRQETTQVPLPPLEATDALVRQLVGGLSSHPVVAAWLATDRLIVNFVVVTGRIADGQTPVAELKAIGPVGASFRVRTSQGRITIDPASYRRYDRYAQAVSALDAQGAARVYETLKPRVNEADRNFGGTGNFDAELERAIVELLKVPVVDGDVPLRMAGIGYAFADPRLEGVIAAAEAAAPHGAGKRAGDPGQAARDCLCPRHSGLAAAGSSIKNAGRMSPAGVALARVAISCQRSRILLTADR